MPANNVANLISLTTAAKDNSTGHPVTRGFQWSVFRGWFVNVYMMLVPAAANSTGLDQSHPGQITFWRKPIAQPFFTTGKTRPAGGQLWPRGL